jgi:hypothetical protein
MGAYYDLIISPAGNRDAIMKHIGSFLSGRGFRMKGAINLASADIRDHKAILLSPPAKGWVAILPGSGVGIDASWYDDNPLARYLSTGLEHCVHVWSLNSGRVVGYAVYANGKKVECESVFSKNAETQSELTDGVPTPPNQGGTLLSDLLGVKYEFARIMRQYRNLEIGLGELVSLFGFDVHLVDYYDATDEKQGVAVRGGEYNPVPLLGWIAIQFDSCSGEEKGHF